jgi:uncharacterized protein
MRRGEREITDRARVEGMLREEPVCRIAFNGEPYPYVVPVNFAFDSGVLYFHGAAEGLKMALLARDPRVCFEVDRQNGIREANRACGWGTSYASVIGRGRARVLASPADKQAALRLLMRKYSGRADWELPALEGVTLVAVDVEELTGKESP